MTAKTDLSREMASVNLRELKLNLASWWASSDSDSVYRQKLRNREFKLGSDLTETLVWGVQPEHLLRLTIGQTAVKACTWDKGAYGFYFERRHPKLEPGTEIDLVKTEDWTSELNNPLEGRVNRLVLFAGNRRVVVRLDRIAETLANGGGLEIVEAPVSETAS